ncbi:MAG: hypothetical protein KKG47_14750 [Proteobacteria bacterium]|nr:hypothetical protein [Pseudomonadota bacterium]MBU1739849.1 hypothetical protein [Pseudomonadota bacterium]
MYLKTNTPTILRDQKGIGLVAAMFAVVILALFGVLIARNIATTTVASADDYRWAQALYSAEATGHLTILYHDGGGGFGAAPNPVVQNVTSTIIENWGGAGNPSTLSVQGSITGTTISRTIEVKYIL